MEILILLLVWVFRIAFWIIIGQAILSWLIAFNVINTRNPLVAQIWNTLHQITEPVYAPIRKILPPMGGFDLTPMVVIFGLILIQNVLFSTLAGLG